MPLGVGSEISKAHPLQAVDSDFLLRVDAEVELLATMFACVLPTMRIKT